MRLKFYFSILIVLVFMGCSNKNRGLEVFVIRNNHNILLFSEQDISFFSEKNDFFYFKKEAVDKIKKNTIGSNDKFSFYLNNQLLFLGSFCSLDDSKLVLDTPIFFFQNNQFFIDEDNMTRLVFKSYKGQNNPMHNEIIINHLKSKQLSK